MTKQQVQLRFRPGAPTVRVREVTGHEERQVQDVSTRSAIDLLSALVEWPQPAEEAEVRELAAPDRDRLLAAIYKQAFGHRVRSTATCKACSSLYYVSFSLDELMAAQERDARANATQLLPNGTFRSPDGWQFRLPTAAEEMELALLPVDQASQALAARCIIAASSPRIDTTDSVARLEASLDEVAPIVDLDIETACPECQSRQAVHFDLQFYVLRSLEQERAQLFREIHSIASAYGWHLEEILRLSRTERRQLVQLVDHDQTLRRRPQ